jgi:hypothetical protein
MVRTHSDLKSVGVSESGPGIPKGHGEVTTLIQILVMDADVLENESCKRTG